MLSSVDGFPTFQDREEMWRVLDFPLHAGSYPGVAAYLGALRRRYQHGRVLFHSFKVPVHPVFDWYLERNLRDSGFFEKFWKSRTPAAAFPFKLLELNFFELSLFTLASPFHVGADLSSILFAGGAYSKSSGWGPEAKRLGNAEASELINEDYETSSYYTCGFAWSEFFHDVAWDSTLVIISKRERLIHAILATDTD
jgi:hypothetical protein